MTAATATIALIYFAMKLYDLVNAINPIITTNIIQNYYKNDFGVEMKTAN